MTPGCEHALFSHECVFDFMFCFVHDGWQNRPMSLHQVFMKFVKSATETLETLCKAFGEHSAGRQFFNGIHVSRPAECQLKMTNVQGGQAPAKQQKMFKKSNNSYPKTITEQSMSS
jgi:hypothetical protein